MRVYTNTRDVLHVPTPSYLCIRDTEGSESTLGWVLKTVSNGFNVSRAPPGRESAAEYVFRAIDCVIARGNGEVSARRREERTQCVSNAADGMKKDAS